MFVISIKLKWCSARHIKWGKSKIKELVNSFVLYLRPRIFWWNIFNDLCESGCVVAFLGENEELLTCNLNIICIQCYLALLIDDFRMLLPKNIISLYDWYLSLSPWDDISFLFSANSSVCTECFSLEFAAVVSEEVWLLVSKTSVFYVFCTHRWRN
jgi:hypothetical protein